MQQAASLGKSELRVHTSSPIHRLLLAAMHSCQYAAHNFSLQSMALGLQRPPLGSAVLCVAMPQRHCHRLSYAAGGALQRPVMRSTTLICQATAGDELNCTVAHFTVL